MQDTLALKTIFEDYHNWVAEHHTPAAIEADLVDCAGYPGYPKVEQLFQEMVSTRRLLHLDREGQQYLLYLIGCQWDCPNILNWLSLLAPISLCGEVGYEELMFLAKATFQFSGPRIEDARFQIIVSMRKLPSLTAEMRDLLPQLYAAGEEYSKRRCLQTMGWFEHPELITHLRRSWDDFDDEYHRAVVLDVVNRNVKDKLFRDEMISKANESEFPLVREALKHLLANEV
jgi:hypothetical protein